MAGQMFQALAASEADAANCASTAPASCEQLRCEEEALRGEESCEAAPPRLPRFSSLDSDHSVRDVLRLGDQRRNHAAVIAAVLSGTLILIAVTHLSLGLFSPQNHSSPSAELDGVQSAWLNVTEHVPKRKYIERSLALHQGIGIGKDCVSGHCTKEDCMELCSTQPHCWSFSFGKVAGQCFLKSLMVKAQDAPATSEGSSDWKTFFVDLCGSRHGDSRPIITAPALTKHELMGIGDVCLELKSEWPCRWTRDYPCNEDPDGSLGHYCCCTRKRPRHVTLSMHPFKKDHALAPKGGNFKIKVVSYNLFWWKLFGVEKGRKGAAGKVVAKANHWLPHIDVIGFQECKDKDRVLRDAGLLHLYATIQAPMTKCIAFRRKPWRLLSHGSEDIGHCVYWNNYGVYGVQWVRLQRKESGHVLFFVNYHGPLSVNSGGLCGGVATAHNILRLINRRSQPGDVVILVGDFNSNPASLTLQELRNSMLHAYTGGVLGGIDNVLTNLPATAVVSNHDFGHGGSDHTAIASVFELGPRVSRQGSLHDSERQMELSQGIVKRMRNSMPIETEDWSKEWCGLMQPDTKFIVKKTGWAVTNTTMDSPDWCCKLCQRDSRCHVWLFEEDGKNCHMMSGTVESAHKSLGFVSGLPAEVATEKVAKSYAQVRALKYAPIQHMHIPHSHRVHHPHHEGNRQSEHREHHSAGALAHHAKDKKGHHSSQNAKGDGPDHSESIASHHNAHHSESEKAHRAAHHSEAEKVHRTVHDSEIEKAHRTALHSEDDKVQRTAHDSESEKAHATAHHSESDKAHRTAHHSEAEKVHRTAHASESEKAHRTAHHSESEKAHRASQHARPEAAHEASAKSTHSSTHHHKEGEHALMDVLNGHKDVDMAVPDTGMRSFGDLAKEDPESSLCLAYSSCKAMGLAGDCCPTADGVRLGCCSQPPSKPAKGVGAHSNGRVALQSNETIPHEETAQHSLAEGIRDLLQAAGFGQLVNAVSDEGKKNVGS